MKTLGLSGTLKVFGAPAEEQLISRPYFVRDGHFDDVDIAFHSHILDEFKTEFGLAQLRHDVGAVYLPRDVRAFRRCRRGRAGTRSMRQC